MNGLSAPGAREGRAGRKAPADFRQTLRAGLFFERHDLTAGVESEDAHAGRIVRRDRLRGDGDVGLAIDVRVDEIAEVHPVEMVAGKNQVVVGIVRSDVACRLPDRVGGALEPAGVVGRLLGGEDLDEAVAEQIHPVGLGDVPVERRGIELRQHEDAAECRRAGSC